MVITERKTCNILLFGPPGCGKGTQSDSLKRYLEFVSVTPGDTLKAIAEEESEYGRSVKARLSTGELFPDTEINDIAMREIAGHRDNGYNRFLFDGYPRTVGQAHALDNSLQEQAENKVDALIYLNVRERILIERLLERGKTSGRSDDKNTTVIRKRLQEYAEKTQPVLDHYEGKGVV